MKPATNARDSVLAWNHASMPTLLPAGTWWGARVCQPAALGLDQSTLGSDEPWGPYGSGKGAQGDRVTGCLWTSGSAAEPRENRGAEHSSLPSRAGPLMSRGDSEACLAWSPAGLLPGRNSASPGCWSPGLRESFGPHVSLCFCSTSVSSQGDS